MLEAAVAVVCVAFGAFLNHFLSWDTERRRIGAERQMNAYVGVYVGMERIRCALEAWPKNWGNVGSAVEWLRQHVRENCFLLNAELWKRTLSIVDDTMLPWYNEEDPKAEKGPVPDGLVERCSRLMRKAQAIIARKFNLDLSE